MSWWPFALDTTLGIIIVVFGALYGMLLGMDAAAKQKQRQFRESNEYKEFRNRMDSLK
jgi:hypothetical protein